MRTLLKIVLSMCLFIGIERFCYKQTGGFRLAKVAPSLENTTSNPPEKAIESILEQPFFFLGSGVQSYAFLSQDGKYVLKLFKYYHAWPSTKALEKIPFFWAQNILKERKKRIDTIFSSCHIAYNDWKEETALVYSHLHNSTNFKRPLLCFDKLGIAYSLDANTTAFVLQKKADLVYPYITALKQQGKEEEIRKAAEELLSLIIRRCKKGLVNHDPVIHRNFGYVDGHPVEIDIGSFAYSPSAYKPYAWKREVFYLFSDNPGIAKYIKEQINEILYEKD